MSSAPNILYLHSHDTGRFIQPYGYAVPTPNLQRLAGEGMMFRQAFCCAPTCSPSRAALLTGQCPHSNGMLGLAHRGFRLNDYSRHLVHALRRVNYRSIQCGVQHVVSPPYTRFEDAGYDEIRWGRNRSDQTMPETEAAAFLAEHHRGPFFLDVGFFQTHRKFPEPGPQEDVRFVQPPPILPDAPETRLDMACFMASARELDIRMGVVLDALDQHGYADNTLVVCTTDHGIAFPGMKCNLTDLGLGVFLILRGPGGFTGGRVCDAMVSHMDVFPTLCELAGLDKPTWLQGQSFLPLVRGEAEVVNEELYGEVTYHAAYEPMRSVRTQRYKYIRRFGDRMRPVLPNCDDGPSKTYLLEHGWADRVLPREALYDLAWDPLEQHNLTEQADLRLVLKDMRRRLEAWMGRTDDPLLRGPVPAPSGAQVNRADGLSPQEKPEVAP